MNARTPATSIRAAGTRAYPVSAATRAIRAVLFGSAAALALAGAPAYAQSCSAPASNPVLCDGAFDAPIEFGGAPGGPVVDLTLVFGSVLPSSVTPDAGLFGISVTGSGLVDVTNFGNITTLDGDGIQLLGTGSALFTNNGAIATQIDTGFGVQGVDINVNGDVGIVNTGTITAAGIGESSGAYALKAWATNGDMAFVNEAGATISASSVGDMARGVDVYAYFGGLTVVNDGAIEATSDAGAARGLVARSGDGISVLNAGSITVTANIDGPEFGGWVDGIVARTHDDENGILVRNTGDVIVTTNANGVAANGIIVEGVRTTSVVGFNAGTISVTSSNSNGTGLGVQGAFANAYARNDGTIFVLARAAQGIDVTGFNGDAEAVNNGAIVIEGGGQGIWAGSTYGDIAVLNAGSIDISGDRNAANYGITAVTRNNTIDVTSSGAITINGGMGFGVILVNGEGTPGDPLAETTFVNSGDISVHNVAPPMAPIAAIYGAFAVGAYSSAPGNAIHMANTGSISASVYSYSALAGVAQGMSAITASGNVDFFNSGSISADIDSASAYGAAAGAGMTVVTTSGHVEVFNSGDVSSNVLSSYYSDTAQVFSAGISVFSEVGDITITNDIGGTVTSAAATSLHATAAAVGIDALTLDGTVVIGNGGAVVATAVSGATDEVGYFGLNDAVGIQVVNPFGLSSSVVSATGASITATSNADFFGSASAFGILVDASTGTVDVQNGGSIVATASALGHVDAGNAATAFGVQVIDSLSIDTTFLNAGSGDIAADAAAELSATATGIALGGLTLDAVSDGRVSATATAAAVDGVALATGVSLVGTDITAVFGSNGILLASAAGGAGTATGLLVAGNTASISNAGSISGLFDGPDGSAQGGVISSDTALSFTNSGTITAIGEHATGVQLDAANATALFNAGTIRAISDGASSAAVRTGASADTIQNTGALLGAIDTGAGNDTLTNGSTGNWIARGASDFGAGDDSITSSGTILLDNATIDLGPHDVLGNRFDNSGSIRVSGDNVIDLGAGNPFAFNNNGTIDFRNGLVGDTLRILGDLGGGDAVTAAASNLHCACNLPASAGSINFDVSGAAGTSDLLYIDGNVQAGTFNTININLLDLPTTAFTNIAMLFVSGDSTAQSFRLGQVNYDPNGSFMTLRFNLVASIDPTNATPDVFSLGGVPGHGGGRPLTPAGKGGTLTDTGTRGGTGNGRGGTRDLADESGQPAIGGKPAIAAKDPGVVIDGSVAAGGVGAKDPVLAIDASAFSAKALPAPAGLEVTGLSDSGTLAASLAPGVQSLLNSQVGTWRQRTGVIDQFRKGGLALWGRLFQDSGKVSPDHVAGNFGQGGNFDFDQRNSGIEVGADFAITDALSVGLLVAKADGRQTLQDGAGVSRIDGDTFGGYATWIADGFYLDASYRHMGFDARLRTSSGENRTSGDADAFSLEGGYAWTVGDGFKIEPQLQYTRISVDDTDALQGTLATFHSTGGVLSRGRLGVMGRKSYTSGSAVLTPYAALSAVREFDGKNGFNINGDFFGTTSVEGTSALVEAGLTVQAGKLAIFGGINWQDGGAADSIVSGQLGMRYGW